MMFVELKNKDISILKKKIHKENNGVCPLLGVPVPLDKTALDHIHKLKSEEYDVDKGTIRNTIEFRSNAMEGKITNNWKRLFGADTSKHPVDLPTFLRNLADYLEAGAYSEDDTYYIHPTEVPKAKKIKKAAYNKLKKLYKGRAKFPEYPKSQKLTKKLEKLFSEYNITDIYYK